MRRNDLARKRIVFCDDDKEILSVIVELAGILGYEAHGFTNARDLIRQIGELNPDVIVSDIEMPDMDGLQLIKCLRTERVGIPFIFLTGHPSLTNFRQGFVGGHFDFLAKPIEIVSLDAAIRKALAFSAPKDPTGKLIALLEKSMLMGDVERKAAV